MSCACVCVCVNCTYPMMRPGVCANITRNDETHYISSVVQHYFEMNMCSIATRVQAMTVHFHKIEWTHCMATCKWACACLMHICTGRTWRQKPPPYAYIHICTIKCNTVQTNTQNSIIYIVYGQYIYA